MQLIFEEKHNPNLLTCAKKISNCGKVSTANDNFIFLDVHNDFIHNLFPLISETNIIMPNYFSTEKKEGAHISIVYPDEISATLHSSEINGVGDLIYFDVQSFCISTLLNKMFFMLKVECEELHLLRKSLGLRNKPIYKGVTIPYFHITIATKFLGKS